MKFKLKDLQNAGAPQIAYDIINIEVAPIAFKHRDAGATDLSQHGGLSTLALHENKVHIPSLPTPSTSSLHRAVLLDSRAMSTIESPLNAVSSLSFLHIQMGG